MYDLLLARVQVEDPANGVRGIRDMALEDGHVAAVAEELPRSGARKILDMEGAIAIPGIVDLHVHVSGMFGDPAGFSMLAGAGVCTAVNMAGPVDEALESMRHACGLNVALLEDANPGGNLSGPAAGAEETRVFAEKALERGALGVKILGGHYPLTPETSERLARQTLDAGGYMALHAGTTAHGSNIEGMREVCELVGDAPVHLAHINSYCRGQVRPELEEAAEAVALLEAHPALISESYVAAANGTSLSIGPDGRLASKSTGATFLRLGYEDSAEGVARAIADGVAFVLVRRGDEIVRLSGEDGLRRWQEAGSHLPGSLDVNPAASRLALALARRRNGDFAVDCLATDGGAIPRNVLISQGFALVLGGALSMADFVRKTSLNPARCLHLPDKGHLGPGADADITVIDPVRLRAAATIVKGRVCMFGGHVCGQGGTVITTPRGSRAVAARGLPQVCAAVGRGPLPFRPSGQQPA